MISVADQCGSGETFWSAVSYVSPTEIIIATVSEAKINRLNLITIITSTDITYSKWTVMSLWLFCNRLCSACRRIMLICSGSAFSSQETFSWRKCHPLKVFRGRPMWILSATLSWTARPARPLSAVDWQAVAPSCRLLLPPVLAQTSGQMPFESLGHVCMCVYVVFP